MTSHLDTRFHHYRTGVEQIDAEHYNLLVLMEVVGDNADASDDEIRLQIAAIVNLFQEHMRHEEAYMDSIDYPYAAYHKQHHAEFLEMLDDYKDAHPKRALQYVTRRLSDHFMVHIDQHDIQLAEYARQHKPETSY